MSASATATLSGLSQADLDQGTLYIEQTRNALLGSAKLLNDAQWSFKPSAERWSAAEIVEHVIAVQERIMGMLRQSLLTGPPPPQEQDAQLVDAIVINQIPNRLAKFPSPIVAECRFNREEALRQFSVNCATLADMLSTVPELRGHVLEAPPLRAVSKGAYSVMDGYQWILATAAHAERHAKQLLEVIAEETFPA